MEIQKWKLKKQIYSSSFCLQFDDWMLNWEWKKIIRENAFKQKKKKLDQNLTPG